MSYRCPLAKLLPQQMDPEQVKRDGWQDLDTLVIHAEDPRLDFVEREVIRRVGDRLYGRRGNNGSR